MDHAAFVLGGWGATAVALAAYTAWLFRRARSVGRLVPEGKRRWSDP